MTRHKITLTLTVLLVLAGCTTPLPDTDTTQTPRERTVIIHPTPEENTVTIIKNHTVTRTIIQPSPTPPASPTAHPSPTARPSPTAHPSPTAFPSPTPRVLTRTVTVIRSPEPTPVMNTPTPEPSPTPEPDPSPSRISLQDKTGSADRANDAENNVTEVRVRLNNEHEYRVRVEVFWGGYVNETRVFEDSVYVTVGGKSGVGRTLVYDGEYGGEITGYFVRVEDATYAG